MFTYQGALYREHRSQRRRRDLNPRAAINDLLPFQGSPFNHLGTSAWLNLDSIFILTGSQKTCQRRGWDSNPRALADKRFSRPPRYDHFDTSPKVLFYFTEASPFCQGFFNFFSKFFSVLSPKVSGIRSNFDSLPSVSPDVNYFFTFFKLF